MKETVVDVNDILRPLMRHLADCMVFEPEKRRKARETFLAHLEEFKREGERRIEEAEKAKRA